MSNSQNLKIPLAKQIGYGSAEVGIIGSEVLIRMSLLIFYTDAVGLRADLAGLAIALGAVWDGFTDPLMGQFSDRFPIRGQRRRPYIFLGSLLLAAATLLLFYPPDLESNTGRFFYLLLSYMFFNTATTIASIPHAALAGDMADGEKTLGRLFAGKLIFANVGLILGSGLPGLHQVFAKEATLSPELFTAIVLAALILIFSCVTLFATKGLDRFRTVTAKESMQRLHWRTELKECFRSRLFLLVLASYFIANLGLTLNSSLALYYYRYRLLLDETDVRLIIAFFMLVFCLLIPFWVMASQWVSKRWLLFWGILGLGVMSAIAYPLFPQGDPWWPYSAAVVGGVFVGSVVLLDIWVSEIAAANTQGQGFGLYFGVWKMSSKMSRALSLALTGHAIVWIGFVPNVQQTPETSLALAILFGPVVGAFFILSAMLLLFAPNSTS